jgi:predicted DNA-binding transcriptional regulator AlpA
LDPDWIQIGSVGAGAGPSPSPTTKPMQEPQRRRLVGALRAPRPWRQPIQSALSIADQGSPAATGVAAKPRTRPTLLVRANCRCAAEKAVNNWHNLHGRQNRMLTRGTLGWSGDFRCTADTMVTLNSTLLPWLLRELSTDDDDMIAFIDSLPDADERDAQALLDALGAPPTEAAIDRTRADYQTSRQLLHPKDALRILSLSRASFYALLKRGTFPAPLAIDDAWIGWPRDILLEWADASERQRVAEAPHGGYAPFERYPRRTNS